MKNEFLNAGALHWIITITEECTFSSYLYNPVVACDAENPTAAYINCCAETIVLRYFVEVSISQF